jgi:hypothetical protein
LFLDVKVNQARDICVIRLLLEDDIVFRRLCDDLSRRVLGRGSLGTNGAFRIGLRQHRARPLDALSPARFPGNRRGTPPNFDNRLNHWRVVRTT